MNTACGVNMADELPLRATLLKKHGEAYKLTVDEQVKCIVEMATDEAILGLTWSGWQPFV